MHTYPNFRLLPLLLSALFACKPGVVEGIGPPDDAGLGGGDGGADGADDSADPGPEVASWTFLVFMNGDNDLEEYVVHDLNELEGSGSGAGVEVIVLADRAEGYDDSDGDWTGTRRYRIVHDDDIDQVSSVPEADLGELDMGDPAVLTDFLMWAAEAYPAEHTALVLWDHGDGWFATARSNKAGSVSYDETSDSEISVAEGELASALSPYVDAYGPLDVVAFDACNMASWEVALTVSPYAGYLTASEAWVSGGGLAYVRSLNALKAQAGADGAFLADVLARDAVEMSGEKTYSAIDLSQIEALSLAVDGLAEIGLASPEGAEALLAVRDPTRGVEEGIYEDAFIDLGDLGAVAAADPLLSDAAGALSTAVEGTMVGAYGSTDFQWTSGITIYYQTMGLDLYSAETATWATSTRWDDWLWAVREMGG